MSRVTSDRLRHAELVLLGLGALAAAALLAWNAGDALFVSTAFAEDALPPLVHVLKLALLEAALLAPFLVIALLGSSLQRETRSGRYRVAGLLISLLATAGVSAMLAIGLIDGHRDLGMHRLMADAVPALMLLTGCAVLYGGLVWLARHAALEPLNRPRG